MLRIIFRPFRALDMKMVRNPGLEAALLHPGLISDAPSGLLNNRLMHAKPKGVTEANFHLVQNFGASFWKL